MELEVVAVMAPIPALQPAAMAARLLIQQPEERVPVLRPIPVEMDLTVRAEAADSGLGLESRRRQVEKAEMGLKQIRRMVQEEAAVVEAPIREPVEETPITGAATAAMEELTEAEQEAVVEPVKVPVKTAQEETEPTESSLLPIHLAAQRLQ